MGLDGCYESKKARSGGDAVLSVVPADLTGSGEERRGCHLLLGETWLGQHCLF